MEQAPLPPVVRGRTSYPFSLRLSHTVLPESWEGKAPRGPNTVEKFTYRDVPFVDRLEGWQPPYWDNLRELALRHWMGSEFDVAYIRREFNPASSQALSKLFMVFHPRVDETVSRVTSAVWQEEQNWYFAEKKINYIQIISYLLTYFNGVFFDDTIDRVSRIYFQNPLSNPPGDTLRVSRGTGTKEMFRREDYWTPELDALYAKSQKNGGSEDSTDGATAAETKEV